MSRQSEQIRIAAHLSPRQRQVLKGFASGKTTEEIALNLGISPKTVAYHRIALQARTGLREYSSFTKLALRLGLDEIDV